MPRNRTKAFSTDEEIAERFRVSDRNMRNMATMIEELEATGLKVVRRDDNYCVAKLIVPETIVLESKGAHGYYPNAVAELYELAKELHYIKGGKCE